MRAKRCRAAVIGALVLVASAACSSVDPSPSPPAGTAPGSVAPGPTAAPGAPMRADLLRLDEARTLPDLGFDLRAQPVLDPAELDVTAIPGPCGRRIDLPFRPGEGVRAFRATPSFVAEALADVGDRAAPVIRQALDQAEPTCESSERRNGAVYQVSSRLLDDLPVAGDEHVGWQEDVQAPDGAMTYRAVALYRSGSRLLLLVATFRDSVNRRVFPELARMAVQPH